MLKSFKYLTMATAICLAPTFASALTLTVDDLGTVGVDRTAMGATTASVTGAAGGFTVAIATGTITSTPNSYTLNTTSIQTRGIGRLQVIAEETGLTGFAAPLLSLAGSASVTDIGIAVLVEHQIDLGGGYQTVGSPLFFAGGTPGPVSLSDMTSEVLAGAAMFDLRTIVTIGTDATDQTANVNATLAAAVPVPAALPLLASALFGMGVLSRRRKSSKKA